MHIERGAINTILVNARPTLTPSRWLLWFRDPERNANVYCLCTALVGGSPTLIRFTETDTPTALSGEVKLSPPGNWELKVYEQTSTTNLNPANAGRLVEAIDVLVVGQVEDETGWSGDPCPPCEGGGDCDPTTVNGTESDTPTITVVQGGVEVGTLNPATGVHTVPECEPEPCAPLTVTLAGVEIVNEADPCGVDVELACDDPIDGYVVAGAGDETANGLYLPDGIHDTCTQYRNTLNTDFLLRFHQVNNGGSISADDQVTQYANENGVADCQFVDIGGWISDGLPDPAPTVRQATIGDICGGGDCPTCEDAEWTLKDTAGNVLDSGAIASGGAADIVAYNVSVQLRDSAANNIGSPNVYLSGSLNNLTAPDGTVTIKNLNGDTIGTQAVKSAGAVDFVAPIPLKFLWQAGDADTVLWTVTADEAGTYTTYTETGTNGTLTYSLNGGGYAALSGTIVLAVGNTITVRRTTTTNAGTVRWAP